VNCPACRKHIATQIGSDGRPSPAIDGSLNICNACGALLTLEVGVLRASNEREVRAAMADPDTRLQITRVAIILRKARHMRS
jgi:hypothetical protein